MRKPIKDEFEKLPISRQRKYQMRMKRDGKCGECGAPAKMASRCVKHLVIARERQRAKKGLKRRYNTLSYQLEKENPGRPKGVQKGEPDKRPGK